MRSPKGRMPHQRLNRLWRATICAIAVLSGSFVNTAFGAPAKLGISSWLVLYTIFFLIFRCLSTYVYKLNINMYINNIKVTRLFPYVSLIFTSGLWSFTTNAIQLLIFILIFTLQQHQKIITKMQVPTLSYCNRQYAHTYIHKSICI